MLPKSVCSPKAVRLSSAGWGGDLMKRTWSPLRALRRWRFGRVAGGRPRLSFRRMRISVTIEWEARMNDSRVGRA